MFFFEGCTCPVCEQMLKKDDDVVVCPKCGAPHHRECYKTNNVCTFDDRHEEGFVWTKEQFCSDASDSDEKAPVKCIFCGTENDADRLYCSVCSRPLFSASEASSDAEMRSSTDSSFPTEPTTAGPFYVAGSEITISDSELIDDVPVGDLKRFVKNTFFYYIPMFYTMARCGKKLTLNFIALFTHGLWFISRKMYLLGSFLLTAQLALQFGINYFNSKYIEFIEPSLLQATSENYSAVLMTSTMEYVSQNPLYAMLIIVLTVLSYSVYAFSGLFANHIYKRTCIKRVKEINAVSSSPEDFNSKLDSQGGISIIATLIFGIIYFIALSYIRNIFMA